MGLERVFILNELSEKQIKKQKELFVTFMDLEKAYYRLDRKGM